MTVREDMEAGDSGLAAWARAISAEHNDDHDTIASGRLSETGLSATIEEALRDFSEGERAYFQAAFAPPSPANTPAVTIVPYALDAGEVLTREKRIDNVSSNGADLAGDTHFRYDGTMAMEPVGANPTQYVNPPLLTGGSSQNARYMTRVQFVTDSRVVKIRVRAVSSQIGCRISVCDPARGVRGLAWGSQASRRESGFSAGTPYAIRIEFPTAVPRLIQYETASTDGFGGVAVEAGASISRPAEPATPLRLAVLGDSFTGGAGSPPDGAGRSETWANFVAKLMGATSFINFGIGGTGYIATANTFLTRCDDILAFDPDVVLILGSRNDGNAGTIQAAVADVLSALASVPKIIVSGPSTPAYVVNNEQVRAATEAAGRTFLDGIAEAWITDADIGTDNIHPTFLGHKKIARGFFEAQEIAVPETPPPPPGPTIFDDFNRADTSSGLGVSSSGVTWIEAGSGESGIASGRAFVRNGTTAVCYRMLTGGASTGVWEIDIPTVGAGKNARFFVNYLDGNNHIRIAGNGTNWTLNVRVTGNTATVIDLGVPIADNDHVRVERTTGNVLKVAVNDVEVYSASETALGANTLFGILGNSGNADCRYDNIEYTPPV